MLVTNFTAGAADSAADSAMDCMVSMTGEIIVPDATYVQLRELRIGVAPQKNVKV